MSGQGESGRAESRGRQARRREWIPFAVAAVIALIMVWLAGAPLELRPGDLRPGRPGAVSAVGTVALLAPAGEVEAFPAIFRWAPVPGAEVYEITVGPAHPDSAPLFRQRGPTNELGVEMGPGSEPPPPGDYLWEVRALAGDRVLGRGIGTFHVRAAP
jgi:hypothetical protein